MNDGLILRSRDHSKHDFGHAVLLAPNDGDSGTEKAGGEGSHLAYAFVDVGAGRQLWYLLWGQFKHPDFSLLAGYLRPDDVDLLLSLYCLALNLLHKLFKGSQHLEIQWTYLGVGLRRAQRHRVEEISSLLTFCKASFEIDIFALLDQV
jgi:hypothetical protein